jgi:hypothetical protein
MTDRDTNPLKSDAQAAALVEAAREACRLQYYAMRDRQLIDAVM